MQIAVAGGKGGSGKTTIAVNLAVAIAQQGSSVGYLDCDLETPNGDIFLQPEINETETLVLSVPLVEQSKCDGCGRCVQFCQHNALSLINEKLLIYPELCRGCGGCWLFCPNLALKESFREVGTVHRGRSNRIHFVQGILTVGETICPPVVKQTKENPPGVDFLVIDSPSGTGCSVREAIGDVDYVILVAEPIKSGLQELSLALRLVRKLSIPCGVVINKSGAKDHVIKDFCAANQVPILAEFPEHRTVAEVSSRAELIYDRVQGFQMLYDELFCAIKRASMDTVA